MLKKQTKKKKITVFLLGMELFEEALQKWEQALNIRHHTHSTASNSSLALQGAMCGDLPVVIIKLNTFAWLDYLTDRVLWCISRFSVDLLSLWCCWLVYR